MTRFYDVSGFLESDEVTPATVDQMKRVEDEADSRGISRILMMENAGGAIAGFIFQNVKVLKEDDSKLNVIFVAGTGNNGGDAFVAARHLAFWKESFDISVILIGNPTDIKGAEARPNYEALNRIVSIELVSISTEQELSSLQHYLESADVAVVGIFGTGFRGEPRELQRKAIQLINENRNALKISVDVPSGLEADTGNYVLAVDSDITITMHAPKVGMVKDGPNVREICGRILVANIGVPR